LFLEADRGDSASVCGDRHYVLIKDLSRRLSSQTSGHIGKKVFFLRCFNYFFKKELLEKHLEYYQMHKAVKIVTSKKGRNSSILEFKNENIQ